MTEFARKPKSGSTKATTVALPSPVVTRRHPALQQLERQARTRRTPGAAQLHESAFFESAVSLQRAAASPVLHAARLRAEHLWHSQQQRDTLQRQMAEREGQLPPFALQSALQRQQAARQPTAPTPVPPASRTPQDWAAMYAHDVSKLQPDARGFYANEPAVTLQRQAADGLLSAYRTWHVPPLQRYEAFGEALATIRRQPLGEAVARVALSRFPAGERPLIQRALNDALQRLQEQDEQDALALELPALQRQLAELTPETPTVMLQRLRSSGGAPLPLPVQRQLEAGLNADFSRVRVHTGSEADQFTKSIGALAATSGTDVFFRTGKFDPETSEGRELLAHELTHVKQQTGGRVRGGLDPDAGLEQEARDAGKKFARQSLPLKPPKPGLASSPTTSKAPAVVQRAPDFTLQRLEVPTSNNGVQPEHPVQQLGVVKHTDGANLRAAPKPNAQVLLPRPLPARTKLFIQSHTSDGWSKVSTPQGRTGYVQTARVTSNLPDSGASLLKVQRGMTAISVAERYYGGLVKPGQDLRFYVNVLEYVNKERGTGAFQDGQALKAGELLWVPGGALAQSLAGRVGSGSITGGAWASAKDALGSGPGASILRSVMESPQYIKEVLGDMWESVKQHWPVILGTTVALVSAELLVGALAAAPEPTTITKFLAVGLQGLITAVAGVGFAVSAGAALQDGAAWLRTAWTAQGNTAKLKAASKSFLKMVGDIVLAAASAAGVKASAGKTAKVAGLYTREQLVAQAGGEAAYKAILPLAKNDMQLLARLLKGTGSPDSLREWLRLPGATPEKLDIILKACNRHKVPLNVYKNEWAFKTPSLEDLQNRLFQWPAENGFIGAIKPLTVKPGVFIDRYGPPTGKFVSPKGHNYGSRALPYPEDPTAYHVYEVLKPLQTQAGEAAPWFGAPGGAVQYTLPRSVGELIAEGVLREVTQK